MKKLYLLFLYATMITIANQDNTEPITLNISHSSIQQTLMPLTIILREKTNQELNTIAEIIKNDLQFTDQFTVHINYIEPDVSKKQLRAIIKNLAACGIPLAILIDYDSSESITWRLYDTMQRTMIAGKVCKRNNRITRGWAHMIADKIWKEITNNDGFFSSRIAYCKDSYNKHGNTIRKIYIADFDGTNEELLVDLPTISIAPRWHIKKPRLFYSEYTNTNARLISTSMNQERKIISDCDGVNMLAAFSDDGKTIVYCSSRGDGSCQLYYHKKGKLKRFTNNSGNNVSPIFIDDTHICFCSDFQTGRPQIYVGDMETGHLKRITKGGYCTSPNYCKKTNTLVYHVMINGTMQLFTYNFATKEHIQLTKTAGNKHEASWSPCGTQLLFSHEKGSSSRLALLNISTKKTRYIGNADQQYSYPNWSPCYQSFPVVI